MFESKTVFIVGAGASKEVGLPIGRELTSKISGLLNLNVDWDQVKTGDAQIYETLKRVVREQPGRWEGNKLIASARHVGEAMQLASSIDTFLESFGDDQERMLLGKLGIAKAIILAEASSKLAPKGDSYEPFSIKNVTDTWFVPLAQLLFSGIPARNIDRAFENVTFIIFNYDRCLEVFLARALNVYFNLQPGAAEEILRNVKFLHPYGSLGSVFENAPDRLPFGTKSADLLSVADRITTFSETIADADTLSVIRNETRSAETLIFLGFGYHRQNFDVLSDGAPTTGRRNARVLGTTMSLSKSDTAVVRSMISNLVWGHPPSGYIETSIHTFGGSCSDFFGEYWRSFTAPLAPLQ